MSIEGIVAREGHVVPPYPEPPPEDLSAFQMVAAMRTNGLSGWSRRVYEETVVQRRLFNRNSFILNEPDAISTRRPVPARSRRSIQNWRARDESPRRCADIRS